MVDDLRFSRAELEALRRENAALRRRVAVLDAVVQFNVDAVFVKDALGRYLLINSAGARLLGMSPEEFEGRTDAELLEAEAARRIAAIDSEVMAGGMTRTSEEPLTAAGVTRSFLVTKGPYRDAAGRTVGVMGISRDITRQERAEDALRETRELLTLLIDHAPALIHVVTADGRGRLFNPAWEVLFGMRRDEVIGRELSEIFGPKLAAELLEENREVLESGLPRTFEKMVHTPQGLRSIYTVKFPLRDASGRSEAVGGITLDVTERKRAEKSLEESRRRLQALFDTSLDAIWFIDDEGRFVDANPTVCALLGYTREEFLRMEIWDITSAEDVALAKRLWGICLETGRIVGEFVQRAKDGSPRLVEYRVVANVLPGVHLAVNRDVSDRERAEREASTLNSALENAVEGISRVDPAGNFATANRAYAGMLGYRPEDLIGKDWRITVHPDHLAEASKSYRRMRAEGRAEVEILGIRRDGSSFWKQNVKVRVLGPSGEYAGHFCFTKDITERKETEAALRDYSGRLSDLSRRLIRAQEDERRNIARELHDEIGQALTAVKLNVMGVLRDAARPTTTRRLEDCIELINRTIGQVRDLSLDLRPSMLDDLGLVDALGSYVSSFAERAGIAAHYMADEAVGRLNPDVETACYRIAQETLTNVARHSGAATVRVELSLSDRELRLVVADDGVGIAETKKKRGPGFGILGMRERATLVGARLEIASEGRGTEVRASFPLDPGGLIAGAGPGECRS